MTSRGSARRSGPAGQQPRGQDHRAWPGLAARRRCTAWRSRSGTGPRQHGEPRPDSQRPEGHLGGEQRRLGGRLCPSGTVPLPPRPCSWWCRASYPTGTPLSNRSSPSQHLVAGGGHVPRRPSPCHEPKARLVTSAAACRSSMTFSSCGGLAIHARLEPRSVRQAAPGPDDCVVIAGGPARPWRGQHGPAHGPPEAAQRCLDQTSCRPATGRGATAGATCRRVSPDRPEHVQGRRLGPDQLSGQAGDAHLREPEHLTTGTEQLQHRLAVRSRRADPQAHDQVPVQDFAQVGYHVRLGPVPRRPDRDPVRQDVAQAELRRCGQTAEGETAAADGGRLVVTQSGRRRPARPAGHRRAGRVSLGTRRNSVWLGPGAPGRVAHPVPGLSARGGGCGPLGPQDRQDCRG